MSIPKITEKIKSLAQNSRGKDILSILTIIIISFGSFFLGRNSATNNITSQVSIIGASSVVDQNHSSKYLKTTNYTQGSGGNDTASDSITGADTNIYTKGNYLASSRGKKYYPIDCPASQNIKESNRVYFKTASEAESKGYTLSTSCN
jgi:hypothetical protein